MALHWLLPRNLETLALTCGAPGAQEGVLSADQISLNDQQ